jgi:hypothetical protein
MNILQLVRPLTDMNLNNKERNPLLFLFLKKQLDIHAAKKRATSVGYFWRNNSAITHDSKFLPLLHHSISTITMTVQQPYYRAAGALKYHGKVIFFSF